jgi:hypothetical protein
MAGVTSDRYAVGLTTFYSFPTPVKTRTTKYGDVSGVETLFKAVLPKLHQEEIKRLESYDFAMGALWICTQLSSCDYIKKLHNSSRVEYWPMRNSGGDYLRKILGRL